MSRTYIVDIDGVIVKHLNRGACEQWAVPIALLPGTIEWFDAREKAGDLIVLMTARKESNRHWLCDQLKRQGLFWDALLMDVGHGERVLVNDSKSGGLPSARAVVVERNKGLGGVE